MKFRKKPVVIEAIQLRWDTWNEMCAFAGVGKLADGKPSGCYVGPDGQALPDGKTSEELGLQIPTREGLHLSRQNDWIINEVKFVSPDIFEQIYELVE